MVDYDRVLVRQKALQMAIDSLDNDTRTEYILGRAAEFERFISGTAP
jgi:hypothetical protein